MRRRAGWKEVVLGAALLWGLLLLGVVSAEAIQPQPDAAQQGLWTNESRSHPVSVDEEGNTLNRPSERPESAIKREDTTPRTRPRVGTWPMFRNNLQHSGYTAEGISPPLTVSWTYATGHAIISSPAVVNGRVYFGSRDSVFYALDAATGKLMWEYKTKGWVDSSPATWGNRIYFASRDGYVYSLGLCNGTLGWRYQTGGTDCSSPAVADGIVYLGSAFPNTDVLALSGRSGKLLWSYRAGQPVYSSPAVKDGIAYIGSNDGKFYCLSPEETTEDTPTPPSLLKWSFQTRGGIYFSSPAISDSLVYCIPGDYDKRIYCLRRSDGSVKWSYEVENSKTSKDRDGANQQARGRIGGDPSLLEDPEWTYPYTYVSSPALAHGKVYFVSGYPEQSVYALDALDGSLKWSQPIGPTIGLGYSSSPTVADSVLYVGSGGGTIYAFDAVSGTPLWSCDLGSAIISSPAVAGGRLYVGTWGGEFYCFARSAKGLISGGGESQDPRGALPTTHALFSPTPNPFAATTAIPFAVASAVGRQRTAVSLSAYDVAGRLVRVLVNETRQPGYHTAVWDGRDSSGELMSPGTYFCRLEVDNQIFTQKLILLR